MKEKEKKSKIQQSLEDAEEANKLKELGNSCFKSKKFEEAVLHYSQGIKLDPSNYSLYSNRSNAFLQMQQYYLSMEDARETIRLQPNWAKGYFRKGEVEFQTDNFFDALLSYQTALVLQPGDPSLETAVERTKLAIKKDKQADEQWPWVGAGIGLIIAVVIAIADSVVPAKPSLQHPIAVVLMIILVALIGYVAARGYRSHVKNRHSNSLDPPVNLLQEEEAPEDPEKVRPRYSKGQSRQRYRKGKA